MSISGILLLNTEIRKDLDAAKQTNGAVRTLLSHLIAAASAPNHLIAAASIPNHPYDVQPWPEEARPKVEMPV